MKNDKRKKQRGHTISEASSVISHQFKSPLSGIKSSLEFILSGDLGPLTPDQEKYLVLALEKVEKMIFLVKDLLDVSRIDQKTLELHKKWVNMEEVVRNVIARFATFAMAKNSAIRFTVKGEVPPLFIDGAKIEEVVNNILFNAVIYNEGKGTIEVVLERKDEMVLFACQDQGIGISRHDRKKVFTKFFRSDKAVELEPTGSGLGLYIARAIIGQSGGRIWFTSVPGKGTTFLFTLPLGEG